MSEINSINIAITAEQPITQAGFGKTLIVGIGAKGEFLELDVLSGNSGLKWRASDPGDKYIKVVYVDPASASAALSVVRSGTGTKSTPYLITVNLATDAGSVITSTASDIKAAAEAVADVGGASKIVDITLLGDGTGLASAFAATALVPVVVPATDYVEFTDPAELLTAGYTATDPEYLLATSLFSQTPKVALAAVYQVSSWTAAPAEIAELRNAGYDSWYRVIPTTRVPSEFEPLATYINTLKKVFHAASDDQAGLISTPETQERCVYIASNHADEYPDGAWIGRCSPVNIGSINWDSKILSGQRNSDVTMSEQSTLLAANINLLREMGGKIITWEGKTRSGQYIDIINGRDYLEARLTEAWHFLKINTDKLDMTAQGIGLVDSTLREVFRDCGRRGIIAGVFSEADRGRSDFGDYQYKLIMPAVDDLPTNDRANRTVSGVKGTARVGGGINYIDVSIAMTV